MWSLYHYSLLTNVCYRGRPVLAREKMLVLNNPESTCTGQAHILKILMSAEKCFFKKKDITRTVSTGWAVAPFDERTLFSLSLLYF